MKDTQLLQLYNGMYNLRLYGTPKYFKFGPFFQKYFLVYNIDSFLCPQTWLIFVVKR